jgi:biopolymer transport protein ExbB/TolQ
MSLGNAIITGTVVFVLVILVLIIVAKAALSSLTQHLAEQRADQMARARESRERLDRSSQSILESQARAEANNQRNEENRVRQEKLWARYEQREERWEQLVTRIEALMDRIERNGRV